jgi:peptide/nickel transport system substrate-binding protein
LRLWRAGQLCLHCNKTSIKAAIARRHELPAKKPGKDATIIGRRVFSAGMGAMLMAPSISRGAAASTLKFIPQSDLTILDPIITTVYTARNHGYMVFDTHFGMNGHYQMEPQMLDGVSVENDGPLRVASFRLTGPYHSGG